MEQNKVTSQEERLATMPIGKLLFSLALPSIVAQIINLLYNLIDRVYIGHIPEEGAKALTGIGVTFPVIILISAFAALVGFGGAPRASIFLGKGKKDKAEEILGNCITSLFFISIVLTIVFYLYREPILWAFGASADTISYASDYLQIYVCGTIFVQFSLGLNAFINSQGFAKMGMFTVLIGAVLNIILDPVFIFGFGMGVKGAALATVISQCVSAVWVVLFLCGRKTILRVRRKNLKISFQVMGPVIALGLAPFIMQSTESILAVCFNTSLRKHDGDIAVGAMTILMSVTQFTQLPMQGLTQGSQAIISYNYGAGNAERVKRAYILTLKSCLCISGFMWVLIMLWPQMFAYMFSTDAELVAYTVWAIRIFSAVACIFGIQTACQHTFVALGNAKTSIFLALLRKVFLLIPLIYILPHFFSDKAFAVFLAEPIADFFAVTVTAITFYIQFKNVMRQMK